MSEPKPCPQCYAGDAGECLHCDGKGTVGGGEPPMSEPKPCPRCTSGWWWAWQFLTWVEPCKLCDDTGTVGGGEPEIGTWKDCRGWYYVTEDEGAEMGIGSVGPYPTREAALEAAKEEK